MLIHVPFDPLVAKCTLVSSVVLGASISWWDSPHKGSSGPYWILLALTGISAQLQLLASQDRAIIQDKEGRCGPDRSSWSPSGPQQPIAYDFAVAVMSRYLGAPPSRRDSCLPLAKGMPLLFHPFQSMIV
jgi:hypothetical protein